MPPQATIIGRRNKCPICDGPYEDSNMVECSVCTKWIHFVCAEEGEIVANVENWKCANCTPLSAAHTSQTSAFPKPRTDSNSNAQIQREDGGHVPETVSHANVPVHQEGYSQAPTCSNLQPESQKGVPFHKGNNNGEAENTEPHIMVHTASPTVQGLVSIEHNLSPHTVAFSVSSSRSSKSIRFQQHIKLLDEQEEILKMRQDILRKREAMLNTFSDVEIEEHRHTVLLNSKIPPQIIPSPLKKIPATLLFKITNEYSIIWNQ